MQVEWLRQHIQAIPTRLVFESALELMGSTKVWKGGSMEGAAAEAAGGEGMY